MLNGFFGIHQDDIFFRVTSDTCEVFFCERLQTALPDALFDNFQPLFQSFEQWIEGRFQEEMDVWQSAHAGAG